jgi:EmrB/QacA subfamily drug resistance transporter
MTRGAASAAGFGQILDVSPRRRMEILIATLLGMFLAALDQTIVGPVLPHIVASLQGADYYTWVVTAYLVTSTATVPIYGKLSDRFGRKPLFMAGIGLFLIGSALSGLSHTMWQLIVFRGVQGLGAGSLFPITLAVIGDLFPPRERGKWQGVLGAVFGIAFLVGPFVGGYLTDHLNWHWIFYVNVPIGLVALFIIGRLLPMVRPGGLARRIDYPGVVVLTGAIVSILLALTNAETGSWAAANVVVPLVVGAALLGTFIFVERRASDPIIPLALFRNRTVSVSLISLLFQSTGFATAIIFLPLWFQVVKGASTTASGYDLFPFLLGMMFSSIVSGQIVSRTGRYRWLISGAMLVSAAGLAFFTNLQADTATATTWIWMAFIGLGAGPAQAVFAVIVQNAAPEDEAGVAMSDLTLFRQAGVSIGMSVIFTAFRDHLSWGLLRSQVIHAGAPAAILPSSPPPGFDIGQLASVGNGPSAGIGELVAHLPQALQQAFVSGFHQAFSLALAGAMWIGVVAALLAFATTLLLREVPIRSAADRLAAAGSDSAEPRPAIGDPPVGEALDGRPPAGS